jgi:hypothetical protein
MRPASSLASVKRRRATALAAGVVSLALLAAWLLAAGGAPGAAAAGSGAGEPSPQTDDSVPARDVTMIGSSPQESRGETWGLGQLRGAATLVRYTPETGWTLGPALEDAEGNPLDGFSMDKPEAAIYAFPSPLAGDITADGAGVLAGTVSGGNRDVLLVRDPGGAFRETVPLPTEGEAALRPGERLLGLNRAPLLAALHERDGRAGALVVPVDEGGGSEERVLHYNGGEWSSEPIVVPGGASEGFRVVGIGASSPGNAWLLASASSGTPGQSLTLYHRVLASEGEGASWQAVAVQPGGTPGEPLTIAVHVPGGGPGETEPKPFTVPDRYQSQVLTVTSEGLWVDGERADAQAPATLFFRPEGEAEGHIVASWCRLPEGTSAEVPPCQRELPEAFARSGVRSFAWANPSTPEGLGERVISGFPEGVSLRLDGTSFTRVLGVGGGRSYTFEDVGGTFGSAFSEPREGWLGATRLPVHLTMQPLASRLAAWPTAFSKALLALAPRPGAPIGSTGSEVLAVGDQGEVARYQPGKGWLPESLLGPGGRHETPRLRAVAWPTPTRAYAVGDECQDCAGQMWLWRAETGLWEPDPATPVNFRGNLMGIAFDPNEPERGYAVGQGGVLLRYGKTWTQEGEQPEDPQGLPPGLAGANFTSIAFAGSEALVTYVKHVPGHENFEGGLLVNNGSGWHIDEQAAQVATADPEPWVVAGLPDGGAAFATEGSHIYERQGAGQPWQETAVPYPGGGSPTSLSLFRENGALRVIAVGRAPIGLAAELEEEAEATPPPGFPPNKVHAFPLAENEEEQGVLRQTANGWSDEEHELNIVKEGEGEYARYDTVYHPDPVAAVLIDPTGSSGWAVGGIVNGREPYMDTSDIWRYPAEGTAPVGVGTSPVTVEAHAEAAGGAEATFVLGGGAQCEAPCEERARASIGPDVWLSHAMHLAGSVPGARAFLYTGPRVTLGRTAGPATLAIPYQHELERYAEVLAQSPLPAFTAASNTDLDLGRNEALFEQAFSAFPAPLGNGPLSAGFASAGRSEEQCASAAGCQAAYYAVTSSGAGGTVRLIFLDTTTDVGPTQLAWLAGQLGAAASAGEPALVVGNADLRTQQAGGDGAAAAVVRTLIAGHASAYLYDSPEQNVHLPLTDESGGSIPSIGSGTLGYVSSLAQQEEDFIGASGVLVLRVGKLNSKTKLAPVSAGLVPNIGELAIEARQGTLRRRSQVSSFAALARRPRSGNEAAHGSTAPLTNPYIPIPADCQGTLCAEGLEPEYTFTSSDPEVGNFVAPNLAAGQRNIEKAAENAVLLGANGKPITDSKSGLFCAYNPGTTIVTISAGGLSSSLPVTIEAGSVRQPCGTVPITSTKASQSANTPAPTPAPAPTPSSSPPSSSPPLPPVPPPPVGLAPATTPAHPVAASFFTPPVLPAFVPVFVPAPVPTPARPTPPSGTSAVTSPVEAPEKEEEREAAPESVSNEAAAYRQSEHEPPVAFLLGLVTIAALAGVGVRARPGRRRRHRPEIAPSLLTTRTQRRLTDISTRDRRSGRP